MGPEFYLPLALLFLASADPSRAQNAEAAVAVAEGDPLTVECALRVEQRAQWRLEGAEPPADLAPAPEAAPGGRLTARLHAPRARPAHAGLYTCGPGAEQRVRVAVLPASAPAPAPTPTPTPTPGAGDAQPTGASAGADADAAPSSLPPKLLYYDVGRPFELNCTDDATPPPGAYVWKVNGTLVERVEALKGRYKVLEKGAKFRVEGRSHEDDFGVYTCGVEGVTSEATVWEVRGRPVVKLQPNSNVVEGQKLRLVCRLVGKPYPAVEWRLHNETIVDAPNRTEGPPVAAVLGARVVFNASEQGVAGAELVVDPAERADAGVYECVPLDGEAVRGETTLRVKDKYAALWPFLGICAEVFVLCAIILIYEKRRSKPELDDSDTDNHDQKKS